jgi:hypothetical protein
LELVELALCPKYVYKYRTGEFENVSKYDVKIRIYGRITASPPGRIWGVGDFDDFAPPETVGKALQRLAAAGALRRIDRGLYDRPRINKLTGKPATADYRAIIEAVARRDKARVLVDGMTAANDLGLSDAVPGRVIVHSDARLKPIRLDNLTITFKPTSASKLYWAGRPAMRVVQALHWLKPKLESMDERQRIKRRITAFLSDPRSGPALRKDLSAGLSALPAWMQDFLRESPVFNRAPIHKTPAAKQAKRPRRTSAA